MAEKIGEPVSVSLVFDHKRRKSLIAGVYWHNRRYNITKQGMHHTYRQGSSMIHVFSVTADAISFRLVLDGSSLIWTLDEAYDPNLK